MWLVNTFLFGVDKKPYETGGKVPFILVYTVDSIYTMRYGIMAE